MERTNQLFKELQASNIYQKIDHAIMVIEQFCTKTSNPTIAFSGGKDSTVLIHLIRNVMKKDIPALFVNTGNEFPEVIKFATKKYTNVTTIRPKIHLPKIINKYGFPLISKEYSKMIYELRKGTPYSIRYLTGYQLDGRKNCFVLPKKYHYLLTAPFSCSDKCCEYLKKRPTFKYNSITGEKGCESTLRQKTWLRTGCNTFGKHSKSKPLSIWTEQDIWEYKRIFDIEFCEIYNDNRVTRTGCMFCGFGATFENISRFEIIKERHPKIYNHFLKIENNGITYREALNAVGIILPDEAGYQHNIFSQQSLKQS